MCSDRNRILKSGRTSCCGQHVFADSVGGTVVTFLVCCSRSCRSRLSLPSTTISSVRTTCSTITVFDQPQLTGRYIVQADGTFTFPLLGRLKAGGLSMQALENELRDRLVKGGFLKQPQVGVSVDQYRSQQIFVMGEVRQPGSLQFTGSMSIIEALARAGSTTEHAGTGSGDPPVGERGGGTAGRGGDRARTEFQGFRHPSRQPAESPGRALAERRASGRGHHFRPARRIGLRVRPGSIGR